MKILFSGNVFNPTGIATANREVVRALLRRGHKIQCTDIWRADWEFNEGLEFLNSAIGVDKDTVTLFADYPHMWNAGYGKLVGHFLHEGTKLHPGWAELLNRVEKLWVPAESVKNLFKWNGVHVPMEVIHYGTNPDVYYPRKKNSDIKEFIFLSVNSWTGNAGDRKGTDILIKAFDEEFKHDENVKLVLKIGTFFEKNDKEFYVRKVKEILGHGNPNILIKEGYTPEEELAGYYGDADCFVMPTRGEGFGLTALNSLACGLPLIITKDRNSGHVDFCKDVKENVLWIEIHRMEQADPRFFAPGNIQPVPDIPSLRKQMRYAFEHPELKEVAIKNSEIIRTKWTWDETARKLEEFLK